jgi:hypothetical protein
MTFTQKASRDRGTNRSRQTPDSRQMFGLINRAGDGSEPADLLS